MDVKNTFMVECPVCNAKNSLRKIQRGDYTIFACSDKDNPELGCKSIITINVSQEKYNDDYSKI